MSRERHDFTSNQAARIAGASWLLVILTGIAAEFFIRMPLMVPGNTAATAANISAAEGLFRLGIAADVVMLVFDAVAATALYVLFRPVHRGFALLATFFRLVMDAVLAANLVHLSLVLLFLNGIDSQTEPLRAMAALFLEAHGSGYDISLVFFGLHCFILGGLIYRSGYVPKLLGMLLLAASLGYLIDSSAHLLLRAGSPLLAQSAATLIGVAVLAELLFSLWLLIRGVKAEPALS
jgi:hypothetical protein